MGQAIVVGEKTRDFEYQFTHWLAAVGIAPVVMFTDACVKASGAVATVFPNAKHFWCYWHIAKNVAKNLKGVLGHDTFTKLVRLMARAHRQVSIVVFEHMWNVEILGDPIFSTGHTYLSATWGGDKVRRWARFFQVGVFTRGIVSTQRVEGIHRWAKEGRLTKRKKQTRRTMYVSRGPVLWGRGTKACKTLTLASKVSPTLNRTSSRSLGSAMASTSSFCMVLTNAAKRIHAVKCANDKRRAPKPHSKLVSPNPNKT